MATATDLSQPTGLANRLYRRQCLGAFGNGNGTFQPAVNYAAGPRPAAVAAAISTARQLDLAVGKFRLEQRVGAVGNGDGAFRPRELRRRPVSAVSLRWRFQWRRQTGPGGRQLRLRTRLYQRQCLGVLGNGDGTFSPRSTYNIGAYPRSVAVVISTAIASQTWPWPTRSVFDSVGQRRCAFGPATSYSALHPNL